MAGLVWMGLVVGSIIYRNFIAQDVFNVVLQFFMQGWILANLNSSITALIPNIPGGEN